MLSIGLKMSETDKTLVPEETRRRILDLCKTHLADKWLQAAQSDLTIKPVADGFVNQSFYCFLSDKFNAKYPKVVVRFVEYERWKSYYDYTHVLAITLLLAKRNIAPKVLGNFEYGTITEFIESRFVHGEDDKNDALVAKLATTLANFQSQEMPIPKDRSAHTLYGVYERWFGHLKESYLTGQVRQEIDRSDRELLKKYNFVDEMNWLRSVITTLDSPILFSHNDFNRRNILIQQSKESSDEKIFLIDFDWTTYNYRGADFGQYYANWGKEDTDWEYHDFPSDDEMSVFINAYIKRMTEIFGDNYAKQDINSLEHLIKESKVHAMNAFVRNMVFCIQKVNDNQEKDEFLVSIPLLHHLNDLDFCYDLQTNFESSFRCYVNLKNRYLKEYENTLK